MLKLVQKAANRYDVEQSLICAIINQESGWKHKVVSPAGAVGVMQIMPKTGRLACSLKRRDLFDPSKNIHCGVRYFKKQLNRFKSIKLALCAYNAGPHRIVKYGKCPPFRETQRYHKAILAAYNRRNACRRAPNKPIKVLPFPPSPPDFSLSAKGRADRDFRKGKAMSKRKIRNNILAYCS
jgi:soluble lytic murein transglycosylase-like protein